jgi:hypothetical protein
MTLATCLLVTGVVWLVSLFRSVRMRALIYSLPIPMTMVLITRHTDVDGWHVLGVVLLVAFFFVVGALYQRVGWGIFAADACGVLSYVAVAAAVTLAATPPILPALAVVLCLWLVAMLVLARRGEASSPGVRADADQRRLPAPLKLVIVFAGSLLTVGLAGALSGFVVTFPYSGILVAVEARHHLLAFSRQFARNSISLVAFLAAYHWAFAHSQRVALAVAWAAFACCAATLHLVFRAPVTPIKE